MSSQRESRSVGTLQAGAAAGMAGGLAEIAWIIFYGSVTGTPTEPVARGVVMTLIPAWAASPWSAWLGILIHLTLAGALGLGLAVAVRQLARGRGAGYSQFGLVMLALAAVWAVNFFIALPYFNPEFVRLLPYGVTLLSKLLFGLSAAMVLQRDGRLKVPVRGR
jgi:hypothetical protein